MAEPAFHYAPDPDDRPDAAEQAAIVRDRPSPADVAQMIAWQQRAQHELDTRRYTWWHVHEWAREQGRGPGEYDPWSRNPWTARDYLRAMGHDV